MFFVVVVVFVVLISQPSLPTPFYSVLVSISVFMALSTVFHSMNSPDNSPLSHSVLQVLILLDSFCISLDILSIPVFKTTVVGARQVCLLQPMRYNFLKEKDRAQNTPWVQSSWSRD